MTSYDKYTTTIGINIIRRDIRVAGQTLARIFKATGGTLSALTLAFQAATAGPSPQAPDRATEVRQAVQNLCAAPGKPLIIDSFSNPYRIVGGAPLEPAYAEFGTHGDLVGAVIGRDYYAYNVPRKLPLYIMAKAFEDINQRIKDGSLQKPSYISLSSGFFEDIGSINFRLPHLQLTPANIAEKRELVLQTMIASKAYPAEYQSLLASFSSFQQMGITVVTAAGNDFSPYKFNIVSLMPGTVTVGAWSVAANGPAPLSNDNSLTDIYRNGDVIGRKIGSGLDVNGDGIRDIARYTGARDVIRRYNGQQSASVLKELPADVRNNRGFPPLLTEVLERAPLEEGLYKTQDLYEIFYAYPLNENHLRDIALYGEYMHYPSLAQFRADAAGNLIYDPQGNGGRAAVIADFRGTSFAVPRVCEPGP